MDGFTYDLVVIGSGPGGQRAAIQGAKLGKRVAFTAPLSIGQARKARAASFERKSPRPALISSS